MYAFRNNNKKSELATSEVILTLLDCYGSTPSDFTALGSNSDCYEAYQKIRSTNNSSPFSVRKLIFSIIIVWGLSDLFSYMYSHIPNNSKKKEKISHQDKITNMFSDNVCKGAIDWTWEKLKCNKKIFKFRWKHFKAPFNKWLFFKANRSFNAEGTEVFLYYTCSKSWPPNCYNRDPHTPVNGTAVDAEEGKEYCAILSLWLLLVSQRPHGLRWYSSMRRKNNSCG